MKCWQLNPMYHNTDDLVPGESFWCHTSTRNDARRILSNAINWPYFWTHVIRLPAGDDIEITPIVGLYLDIYDWHGCFGPGCSREVRADDWGTLYAGYGERVTFGVVDWQGRVYCSPECAGIEPDGLAPGRLAEAERQEQELFGRGNG